MNHFIKPTEDFVRKTLSHAEGGHDWWHIERVRKMAVVIGRAEGADVFVVEMGALLHDIADAKFHDGDEEIGPRKARYFLESIDVSKPHIEHIVNIIRHISFKNSFDAPGFSSLELKVLQDADRLDAMGAIGIARTFNYGGHTGSGLYDPDIPPMAQLTKSAYKKSKAPTINHFYEKLLKLKQMMHTETAKRLAEGRHQFMVSYLEQFYKEWEGEL